MALVHNACIVMGVPLFDLWCAILNYKIGGKGSLPWCTLDVLSELNA